MIIAISGASGSGKSTLAAALAERFKGDGETVLCVSSDKYFKKELPRMISPSDGKEYPDWNHPDSFDADAMRKDLTAARDSGQYGVILFEGVTVHWTVTVTKHRRETKRVSFKLFIFPRRF